MSEGDRAKAVHNLQRARALRASMAAANKRNAAKDRRRQEKERAAAEADAAERERLQRDQDDARQSTIVCPCTAVGIPASRLRS